MEFKRKCLNCDKDIGDRRIDAIYCGINCSLLFRMKSLQEGIENDRDYDKWCDIYMNSSINALREIAGLKNFTSPQADSFRQLIIYK